MDGLSPSERPTTDDRRLSETDGRRVNAEPSPPEGAEWLSEFLHRETTVHNRPVVEPNVQSPEPAEKSYKGPVLIGFGVLVAAGLLAAGLFAGGLAGVSGSHNLKLSQYALRIEAWTAGLRFPDFGHSSTPRALALNGPVAARPLIPLQPAAPYAASAPAPATTPLSSSDSFPQPPVAAPRPVPSLPVVLPTTPPASDTLPDGTPLHLRIVYEPSSQTEVAHMDALAALLSRQTTEVASATASAGATPEEAVVYFFPDDAVGALRVAASLSRITNRSEPVTLVHSDVLPRPGTVEIRLPLKVAKDLSNEGS